jgi:hypothetical protein
MAEEQVSSEPVSEPKFPASSEINRDLSAMGAQRRARCSKIGIALNVLP